MKPLLRISGGLWCAAAEISCAAMRGALWAAGGEGRWARAAPAAKVAPRGVLERGGRRAAAGVF